MDSLWAKIKRSVGIRPPREVRVPKEMEERLRMVEIDVAIARMTHAETTHIMRNRITKNTHMDLASQVLGQLQRGRS